MVLLEVEQKFSWSLSKLTLLAFNKGYPPFKSLIPKKTEYFTDTYFDSGNRLSDTGLWVRKRLDQVGKNCTAPQDISSWEAKQSATGTSHNRSVFNEVQDTREISRMIEARFPKCLGPEHNFGLDEMCKFQTMRHTFLADGKFTVVLDATDFDHQVGEVELLAEDADKAHADIDAFMNQYAWVFDTSNPTGKLTAYFEKFGYPK